MIDAISIRIFSSLTHRGLLNFPFHGDGQVLLIFRSDTRANYMTHLIYRECAGFFAMPQPRADDQTAFCRTLPNSAGPFRAFCVWWRTSECGERFGWLARTLQSAVHVWSKSAAKKASSSLILQPGLCKKMGNPHTINFRNCCDLRLSERNESKVTNARRKTMIEHNGLSRHAVGSERFVKVMRKRFEAQKRWARQMEGATKAVCWRQAVGRRSPLTRRSFVSSDMRFADKQARQEKLAIGRSYLKVTGSMRGRVQSCRSAPTR